jgi:5-methylcytosine-specific restriction endonuclease McrA
MLHSLLLNYTYEPMSFISDRKLFKLLAKDKIEILEFWEGDAFSFGKGIKIKYPAVVRLKHHVRWIPKKAKFNRKGVFLRDRNMCQYCAKVLTPNKVTMDHVFPRARGGENSWKNCVASCTECNNKKGAKTPEEAKMVLLKKPVAPQLTISNEFHVMKNKHDSWNNYIIT